jgi:hypothetical protein
VSAVAIAWAEVLYNDCPDKETINDRLAIKSSKKGLTNAEMWR